MSSTCEKSLREIADTKRRVSAPARLDQTYFIHVNALGSAAMESVSAGNVSGDTLFYPWGQTWVLGTPEWHYAGFQYAAAADLYVTPFRQYSNTQGRWLSPDPAGVNVVDINDPQTWNAYAYARNNPTTMIDPSGLTCVQTDDGATVDNMDGSGCGDVTGDSPGQTTVTGTPSGVETVTVPWGGPSSTSSYSYGGGLGSSGAGQGAGAAKTAAQQAATKYCQDHGQLAFNIPFTTIPVTVSLSGTAGPVNYSATNDITPVAPLLPWPEWLSFGVGLDITINAPATPMPSVSFGVGKNLSAGQYLTPNGLQGLALSGGVSVGPPAMLSLPAGNGCGVLAGHN